MPISCKDFFSRSGWRCQALEGVGGTPGALYVSTPFLLSGRKPLDFYVEEGVGDFKIYDDGATLFALSNLGFDLSDRRNWRSLHSLAEKYSFVLSEDGEFIGTCKGDEFMELSANALALFSAIRTWEKERSREGDADFSLSKQVEEILFKNSPDRRLQAGAIATVGLIEVNFDFLWGDIYVDALNPVANAVNSRLRKGLLMKRLEQTDRVLFIVDDTHVPSKAEAETAVLKSVAPSLKLSTMRNLSSRYEVGLFL